METYLAQVAVHVKLMIASPPTCTPSVVASNEVRETMSKPVMHKQVYRRGPFGGVMNTTLCGRLHSGEEMNVESQDNRVTCKFCLRVLEMQKERASIQRLHNAVEFAERVYTLPRCEHGSCLRDHAGELLEPDCGCRFSINA